MLAYLHRDLTCCFADQAYETRFGVTPEALIGTHIRDLLGLVRAALFAIAWPTTCRTSFRARSSAYWCK